jgi:MerR family transcriptional regulator/heat shock protein HspR
MKREVKKKYTISVVAEMYNIHPQTLRLYEKEGLIKPYRSKGRTRYYTEEDTGYRQKIWGDIKER